MMQQDGLRRMVSGESAGALKHASRILVVEDVYVLAQELCDLLYVI